MATGIEAAGLVLGAFPLVISFLEHYRSGLETLQEWWRFRTEFLTFFHEVGVQSVFFSENLEALLAPLVDSEEEMEALLADPGGPQWRAPGLEERLKERLPKSYDWYKLTITAIDNILENLKKRLGIKPGVSALLYRVMLKSPVNVLNLHCPTPGHFIARLESERQDPMGVRVCADTLHLGQEDPGEAP